MTCLGPYEMLYIFFLTFFCYQILCFSSSNYFNANKLFIYFYSSLMKYPPPLDLI